MTRATLFERLQQRAPHLPGPLLQDFLDQMDPDYFEQFPFDTIFHHLELTAKLSLNEPCSMTIETLSPGHYQIHVVAYDYFSEFATFCGILASFGLDIREAEIFTSHDAPSTREQTAHKYHLPRQWNHSSLRRPIRGLSRKIAVDVFQVQAVQGFSFGPLIQQEFQHTVLALLQLLQQNQVRQARRQVNRRLIEHLGKIRRKTGEFLHPVHIAFSNPSSSSETILDIRSMDTPAFLYAFANALAMRGIYLEKAKIEVKGHQVFNRLYIRNRHGGKLQTKSEQQELRTAAALLKEFTYYLSWAPDPGKALDHFDQFLDQLLEDPQKVSALSTLTQASTLERLAQLFGSSDYLWEDLLRRQHHNLLPIMRQYQKGPLVRPKSALTALIKKSLQKVATIPQKKQKLNQCKDEELFRIDMRHLVENSSLREFSHALTNLADVILTHTLELSFQGIATKMSRAMMPPMAIFGLGKLGGGELGYASDIEILFVYASPKASSRGISAQKSPDFYERWAQEFLQWIEAKQEGIFHIDTRLRPHGDKGTLANSLEEIQAYYRTNGPAAPFERQAFIKLRYIAGPPSLKKAVETHRDHFVYGPDPWDLPTALHLRQRQMAELVRPGTIHVKYGPGGLLDVEYMVQYLQLIHGHAYPPLRTPNTLEAIEQLCHTSILSLSERDSLQEDYLFLRQLIDGLRIVRGNTKDLVLPPSGSDEMVFLARRLGIGSADWKKSAKTFEQATLDRMAKIHKRFLHRFSNTPTKKKATRKK